MSLRHPEFEPGDSWSIVGECVEVDRDLRHGTVEGEGLCRHLLDHLRSDKRVNKVNMVSCWARMTNQMERWQKKRTTKKSILMSSSTRLRS